MQQKSFGDFKKFYPRLIKFLIPIILVLSVLNYGFYRLPNSYQKKLDLINTNAKDIQVLVLGSSHPLQGIDPKYFDFKGFNMANSGQDFYYDTELTQTYIDKMPNLRMVIFVASYHSFEYRIANKSDNWRMLFYQKYYQIPLERGGFIKNAKAQVSKIYYEASLFGLLLQGKNIFKQQEDLTDLGVRIDNTSVEKSDQTGLERIQYHHAEMIPGDFDKSYQYLEREISLLKQRNIEVVLLSLPVYKTYSSNFDPQKYGKMQDAIKKLTEEKRIKYYNFIFDPRFESADFSNDDHLNTTGAQKMSLIINSEILKPILR